MGIEEHHDAIDRGQGPPTPRTEVSHLRQLAVASLLILLAAACGGSVSGPAATGTEAPANESEDQVGAASDDEEPGLQVIGGDVEGTDDDLGFAFAGQEIAKSGPAITAKAGEPIMITFENVSGSERHDLVVVAEPFPSDFIHEPLWEADTSSVEPGGSETISFTPDTPGSYSYVCTIFGHIGRGMIGDFIVEG